MQSVDVSLSNIMHAALLVERAICFNECRRHRKHTVGYTSSSLSLIWIRYCHPFYQLISPRL